MSDTAALLDVAARMEAAFAGGLRAQLQWMEDLALALDAAGVDAAAADVKAALGALVHWARGPQDPATLPEVEAVMRTFLARGVAGLYRAVADDMRALADTRSGNRALCLDLAGVFASLARSVERAEPPPPDTLERLAAARALVTAP